MYHQTFMKHTFLLDHKCRIQRVHAFDLLSKHLCVFTYIWDEKAATRWRQNWAVKLHSVTLSLSLSCTQTHLPPMRKSSPATYCMRSCCWQHPRTPMIQPKRMIETAMPTKPAVILRRSAAQNTNIKPLFLLFRACKHLVMTYTYCMLNIYFTKIIKIIGPRKKPIPTILSLCPLKKLVNYWFEIRENNNS